MNESVNHEEAEQLANLKREESNLARCYLDVKLQVDELRAELKKAHDGHGYRNGLGPCICKWCAEKLKPEPQKPRGTIGDPPSNPNLSVDIGD